MTGDVDTVLQALVRYGLRVAHTDLSYRETQDQKIIIEDLLEDNNADVLIEAIKYGMPRVWPFSEDNRTFDASDLKRNILKAKGEAGRVRRQGEIAYRPR